MRKNGVTIWRPFSILRSAINCIQCARTLFASLVEELSTLSHQPFMTRCRVQRYNKTLRRPNLLLDLTFYVVLRQQEKGKVLFSLPNIRHLSILLCKGTSLWTYMQGFPCGWLRKSPHSARSYFRAKPCTKAHSKARF